MYLSYIFWSIWLYLHINPCLIQSTSYLFYYFITISATQIIIVLIKYGTIELEGSDNNNETNNLTVKFILSVMSSL